MVTKFVQYVNTRLVGPSFKFALYLLYNYPTCAFLLRLPVETNCNTPYVSSWSLSRTVSCFDVGVKWKFLRTKLHIPQTHTPHRFSLQKLCQKKFTKKYFNNSDRVLYLVMLQFHRIHLSRYFSEYLWETNCF